MSASQPPIRIATRGSALALAQAHQILAQCRAVQPGRAFELRVMKTTGDKLQTASMAKPDASLPKGLFTKELEVALLQHQADLAVHSLKDLPTDLPAGLELGAVSERVDARDVLILRAAGSAGAVGGRSFPPGTGLMGLPVGAVMATSSTRRAAQLLARRPDVRVVEIRGNVPTRLRKLAEQPELDATLLAAAGLIRLQYEVTADGLLRGDGIPANLVASPIGVEEMIPCVGQAAIGIEVRAGDDDVAGLCRALNHEDTFQCVTAERAFLRAMGGGCQSPIAGYAEVVGKELRLRAVSFRDAGVCRATETGSWADPVALGERVAARLLSSTG